MVNKETTMCFVLREKDSQWCHKEMHKCRHSYENQSVLNTANDAKLCQVLPF